MNRRTEKRRTRRAVWLVLAGMFFNLGLCLVSTHVHPINATVATVCELAILVASLPLIWDEFDRDMFCAAGLISGWLAAVHIIDPALGQTVFVALAIPTVFFSLGRRCGSLERADRLVLIISAVTLAVGIFELCEPALFQQWFNVLAFYIQKGGLKANQAEVTGTQFFVSGIRPADEGRSLFPALGDHRASSVFLEPISLGDFAVITAMWAMVRHQQKPGFARAVVAMAAANAVLADSRLAVGTAIFIAVALTLLPRRTKPGLLLLPMLVIGVLLYIGLATGPRPIDDTLAGRLYSAGTLLAEWGPEQWFGIVASPRPDYDCGYAQLLAGLGAIPAIMLWAVFVLWPANNPLFQQYRCALALYLCISLSITGSVLSIKTGALAWFLLGCAEQREIRTAEKAVPLTPSYQAGLPT